MIFRTGLSFCNQGSNLYI